MQATKSFFAARGDNLLRGPNIAIRNLGLSKSDFVDMNLSTSGDGTWVQIVHRKNLTLRLLGSSIINGAWIRNANLPANISLHFNVPVDETSVTADSFKWIHTAGTHPVIPANITFSEQHRVLTIPLPMEFNSPFEGTVVLVGDGFSNDNGDRIDRAVSVSIQITGEDVNLPNPGTIPYTNGEISFGNMQLHRLVAARGMGVDRMIDQFIRQKNLQKESILKIAQNRGPNDSVEVFVLRWAETSPHITSLTPMPESTVAAENTPTQIVMQFDQPVGEAHLAGQDGVQRLFVDGTHWAALSAPQLVRGDVDGRVWVLSGITEISSPGRHTLLIRNLPNRFGDFPSPPMLFGWQVEELEIVGGGSGTKFCETPAGLVDGINDTFTLTHEPIPCGIILTINGIFQHPDCYSIVDNTIIFDSPPFAGAEIYIIYEYDSSGSGGGPITPSVVFGSLPGILS